MNNRLDPRAEAIKLALFAAGAAAAYALGRWGESLPTIWQSVWFR